jgi:hypothetical protein
MLMNLCICVGGLGSEDICQSAGNSPRPPTFSTNAILTAMQEAEIPLILFSL